MLLPPSCAIEMEGDSYTLKHLQFMRKFLAEPEREIMDLTCDSGLHDDRDLKHAKENWHLVLFVHSVQPWSSSPLAICDLSFLFFSPSPSQHLAITLCLELVAVLRALYALIWKSRMPDRIHPRGDG